MQCIPLGLWRIDVQQVSYSAFGQRVVGAASDTDDHLAYLSRTGEAGGGGLIALSESDPVCMCPLGGDASPALLLHHNRIN